MNALRRFWKTEMRGRQKSLGFWSKALFSLSYDLLSSWLAWNPAADRMPEQKLLWVHIVDPVLS